MLSFIIFLIFSQIRPIDLPEKEKFWRYLTEEQVLQIAELYGDIYAASTLALMKIEQPSRNPEFLLRVPNNNAGGIHPWKKRYPWGWSRYWELSQTYPDGYVILREAMTKKYKPYFSFPYFLFCFRFILEVVKSREIINGRIYSARWSGSGGYSYDFDRWRDYFMKKLRDRIKRAKGRKV